MVNGASPSQPIVIRFTTYDLETNYDWIKVVMAYIVMAHTVMAYIVMAHTVMAYIIMAYLDVAYMPTRSRLTTTGSTSAY